MALINWIARLIDNFFGSFDTKDHGFSARKLSAFASVSIGAYATFRYCTAEVLDAVLSTWLLFAAACLGLITAQQLISTKIKPTTTNEKPTDQSGGPPPAG